MEKSSTLNSLLFNESILIIAVLTLVGTFWMQRGKLSREQLKFLLFFYTLIATISAAILTTWTIPIFYYWEKIKKHWFLSLHDGGCGIISFFVVSVSFYLLINEDWWW
jgi:hypothetical protein